MTDRVLDYYNNDVVAELDSFVQDPLNTNLTDFEYLCAVAKIVDQRRIPSADMTDCATGKSYETRVKDMFEKAFKVAKRNAGL